MHERYTPWPVPGGYAVLDWQRMELCGLPKEVQTPKGPRMLSVQLQWRRKVQAEAWLRTCYQVWARWEKDGAGKPPKGWRPRRAPSPYDNGLPFLGKDR